MKRAPEVRVFLMVIVAAASPSRVLAQKTDSMSMAMPGMTAEAGGMKMGMIPGALGIPMERLGSGTTWLPDATPMHAIHLMSGSWELMLHGVAFGMYDRQYGDRGSSQFSSVNWGMLMASRKAAGGRLQLRGMLSAEPYTVGGAGYPLLLQTGETFQGVALHDRQHPHDLIMELAALYEHDISRSVGMSLYLAPAGEPASGPVAFPHRPSAMSDPLAPISHHWQDATHISYGVVTAGVFTRALKLEGSVFNGREPDENRTNLDYSGRSLDSYATRLTWNPGPTWSASGSYAFLKSPEANHPDESVKRFTASILNSRTFGSDGLWATALIMGSNLHSGSSSWSSSYLIESNLHFDGPHAVFGRVEYSQKSAEDLVVDFKSDERFGVTEISGGYLYDFDRNGNVRTGVGARASVNIVPQSLERYYGSRTPHGLAVFLRFSPQMAPPAKSPAGTSTEHNHGGSAPTPMAPMPGMQSDTMHAMSSMPGMAATPKDSTAASSGTGVHAMPGMMHDSVGVKAKATAADTMTMDNMPGMKMPSKATTPSPATPKKAAVVKPPATRAGAKTPAAKPGVKAVIKKPLPPKAVSKKPAAKKPVVKKPAVKKPPAHMPGMPGMKMPGDTGKQSRMKASTL
jgi:hypothetical protein